MVLVRSEARAEIAPFSLRSGRGALRLSRCHSRSHAGAPRSARADAPGNWLPSSRRRCRLCTARDWLEEDRAQSMAKEPCEKATVHPWLQSRRVMNSRPLSCAICARAARLTAGLVLRALRLRQYRIGFRAALAELSDLPHTRVSAPSCTTVSAEPAIRRALLSQAAAGIDLSGVLRGDRGPARGRRRRQPRGGHQPQAPHGRAVVTPRCAQHPRRYRAVAHAVATSSLPRPHARKLACSAMIWSPATPARRPTSRHARPHEIAGGRAGRNFVGTSEAQNGESPGASAGDRMSSSSCGRSRFSCQRNSSVTSAQPAGQVWQTVRSASG